MSSNWWDNYFCDNYLIFYRTFVKIITNTILFRALILIVSSYEEGFGNYMLELILVLIAINYALRKLEKSRVPVKKISLLIITTLSSIILRTMSIYYFPKVEPLFCIYSTMVLLLYEVNIFENEALVIPLLIRHVIIWTFLDKNTLKISIDIQDIFISVICTTLNATTLCYNSESFKRKSMREKHLAEKSSKDLQDQLQNILKGFPDGLILVDDNLEEQYKNDAITKIFKNGSVIVGLNKQENIYTNTKIASILKEFINSHDSKLSLAVFELENKHYELIGNRVRWNSRDTIMLIIRDVSAVVALERVSSENKQKNLLLHSISHELRTPINCINLIVDQLHSEVNSTVQVKLNQISTCTKLLNFQINDIFDYTEISLGTFLLYKEEISLRDILKECLEIIRFQADYKKVMLSYRIDKFLPESLLLDKYRFQKIVINLLTNALKYTPSGSIDLYALHNTTSIKIGVTDTGIGIRPERLSSICQMFKDTSSSSLSGLGLHITQKILQSFNSNLSVKSKSGEGSEFSFNIPLSLTHHKRVSSESIMKSPAEYSLSGDLDVPSESNSNRNIPKISAKFFNHETPKVLIVDDNEFNLMCLSNIFRSEGIDFIEALNGEIAIEKVKLYDMLGKPIQCVIMDINMPVMDGLQASKIINQFYLQGKISTLPGIIGHSAFSTDKDIQFCFDAGMISYIPKPAKKKEILEIVRKFI